MNYIKKGTKFVTKKEIDSMNRILKDIFDISQNIKLLIVKCKFYYGFFVDENIYFLYKKEIDNVFRINSYKLKRKYLIFYLSNYNYDLKEVYRNF